MGVNIKFSDLYKAPDVNPVNRKAHSIPALNPINMYGRVFFFSWFGFMIAFWAWYTFPPLLTVTIKADLHLTPAQVANSNIVSLVATLFIRFVAGPLCDMYGPRRVFAGTLLVGALPLGLAPLIHNATGLYVSRFFIGILGGSFVPCQVWSTGFFDKNIVGTANALTGGFGNAGGGITYFIMPAVYDSFVHMGHTPHQSWRLTFIVPLIMAIATGLSLLLLCPDTPMGKWSERHLHVQENLQLHGVAERVVDIPGGITDKANPSESHVSDGEEKKPVTYDHEAALSKSEMIETAQGETIQKPTLREALPVIFSQQTAFHFLTYFCSFGGELAINAILSSYYLKNFPTLGQTKASNWAAMFGFLNFVTRPLGGVVSDLLYNLAGRNLWLKKGWITTCGVATGALLILIGQLNSHHQSTMYGLVALMAFFLEAGNGANFALVPHVHPFANGILSGVTGAGGNLGGVVFAVIFRFMGGGTNYAKAFWVIGVVHIAMNLSVCWIRPLPKGQIGGH
ncbi:nitrite transporter [Coniochaeta ligniaria NRRL 30616]|uniref:Nitrate/nitrite transporter n=1 Tax=Coniochaeta ligniaria NRRL 30616 TaxID=1408157 RepID=A0A1J7JYE5_9PEZI|nr:nitrite transporter [Coniochaeta ligniaria NRRL 30616]